MKHIILTLLLIVCLIGCMAHTPTEPIKHQLEISVQSTGDSSVGIDTDEQVYTLPESPYLQLSMISSITHTGEAIIKLWSGLSVSDYTRAFNDLLYLEKETDIRRVIIILNSPGGDAFAGMALADLLHRYQDKKEFEITAYGSGVIASAAVPVFSVCKTRIAAPGTMFMVHEASLWKWPGRETASDIRSQNELMAEIQKRYLSYLPKTVNCDERWIELMKMQTWFNAEKALEWGVATSIE